MQSMSGNVMRPIDLRQKQLANNAAGRRDDCLNQAAGNVLSQAAKEFLYGSPIDDNPHQSPHQTPQTTGVNREPGTGFGASATNCLT